tara:strand:+ start:649 stop:1323 length:675 start_codon:yes stop_codon:yes gene_type:complete
LTLAKKLMMCVGSFPLDFTFTGEQVSNSTGSTTNTFTSVDLGAADANRNIIVMSTLITGSTNTSAVTMTIGGVTATQLGFERTKRDNVNKYVVWHTAAVPTGATGTIVASGLSSNSFGYAVSAYRTLGTISMSGSPVVVSDQTTAMNITLTVPDNGFALYGCQARNGTAWTSSLVGNATEVINEDASTGEYTAHTYSPDVGTYTNSFTQSVLNGMTAGAVFTVV